MKKYSNCLLCSYVFGRSCQKTKTIIPDNKFFMFSPSSGYKSDIKIIYQLATLYPKIMYDIGMSIGLD